MSFKMQAPFKKDSTPVYQVPFSQPGLVAKANKNGTIIVNKDLANNEELMSEAMSHEKQHLNDMLIEKNKDGSPKLDYDSNSVTYKGKKYNRDSFNEGNENLPWEKPAYEAGRKKKQIDLTPNPEKLDGPPSFSPMSFDMMGGKSGRRDEDEVSMNESFAMFMKNKRWSGPSETLGGTEEEKKKAKKSAEADAEENMEKDEGETTVDTKVTNHSGVDDKGEFDAVTTDTTTTTRKKGDGTGDTWEERRQTAIDKGWVDPDITLEEYIAKAEAQMVESNTTSNTEKKYKEKTEEGKKEVKTPEPVNLATLLEKYRINNPVDLKYYDSYNERPARHTPESYAKENPGFKAFVEAEKRKAVSTGGDLGDDSVLDDVDRGKNINKGKEEGDQNSESPVSMLVSRFKKIPHRG